MIYEDSIYGIFEIEEPVIEALVNTAVLQRLKGVLQHGITGLLGITDQTTRFDHSLGTMLVVRQLGGSLEEQIAALLHDISHTAFSHVIDYVVDGHDQQSYHDEIKESYLAQTELPALLAQFGYDWHDYLHEAAYPLLEQPSPRLCADRIDYFLRDAKGLGLAAQADIDWVRTGLVVADGRIATNQKEAAQWLATTYLKADDASWANFREVGLYEVTARAIRRGLEIGIINDADFFLTDEPFWQKLQQSEDPDLNEWLSFVSTETEFIWDETSPTFWVSTKLRSIDPDVVVGGVLRPLSTLDPSFKQQRSDYLKRKQGKWPVRVAKK